MDTNTTTTGTTQTTSGRGGLLIATALLALIGYLSFTVGRAGAFQQGEISGCSKVIQATLNQETGGVMGAKGFCSLENGKIIINVDFLGQKGKFDLDGNKLN